MTSKEIDPYKAGYGECPVFGLFKSLALMISSTAATFGNESVLQGLMKTLHEIPFKNDGHIQTSS